MYLKEKASTLFRKIDNKFSAQFGFRMKNVTFTNVVMYLHKPVDSSSLAVARILFGLCMLLDIPDERGGSVMDSRWGQPMKCHFPLFPFITAIPMPYMALVYAASWIGALGITLGYKFKLSSAMFTICHWYILLIDKSFWNNHSYLFGLVGLLMTFTQANCYWSIDAYLNTPVVRSATVPYWNYFILKYQFTILYFMAGVKKGTSEWLSGYSVRSIAEHWVFDPFKHFLSVSQINQFIVHWFIFVFDLTVAFWMMWGHTRTVAMVFCALFHLMNSRLFAIGMFPWVCLATMPLYYPFDWPKTVHDFIKEMFKFIQFLFLFIRQSGTIICKVDNQIIKRVKCNDDNYKKFEDEYQEYLTVKNVNFDETSDESSDSEECDTVMDEAYSDEENNNDENSPYSETFDAETIQREYFNGFDGFQEENREIDLINAFNESHNDEVVDNKSLYKELKDFEEKTTKTIVNKSILECKDEMNCEKSASAMDKVGSRKKLTTIAIIVFVVLQAFLPFSHFITKGYNNWTDGLYGYSWDMMVHTWTDPAVSVEVTDNDSGRTFYVDTDAFTLNDRWTRHGDMVHQFANYLGDIFTSSKLKDFKTPKLGNISIYVDIWYSLNGRFTQPMFNSKMDLLKTPWSPFEEVPYLVPLLDNDEALKWRVVKDNMKRKSESWDNNTDVAFYANLPGYDQVKYLSEDLKNVTLTILDGTVGMEECTGHTVMLKRGYQVEITSGKFYRLLSIGTRAAYYTLMSTNVTAMETAVGANSVIAKPKLPIAKEMYARFEKMRTFANLVFRNVFYCLLMSRCG